MKPISEQEFLQNYKADTYSKPSVATDIVAFSIFSQEEENYRKLPVQTLNVLLIKRGEHPYKDTWALPGGFARERETLEETAARELYEEAGVQDVYMEQLYTVSDLERDPRTRVISASYMALIPSTRPLVASTDAISAAWFEVSYKEERVEMAKEEGKRSKKVFYTLSLSHEEECLEAHIVCEEIWQAHMYHKSYRVESCKGVAFDHSKIIGMAVERLRGKLEYTNVAFYLLPEFFTLTRLQKVYEVILDKSLIAANFRRKMMDKVQETEEVQEGGGYRNAKLFTRKEY